MSATASSAAATTEDVIRIDGVYYSTVGLAAIHPGGDAMVLMCNRQDGTAIYNSSHRRPFPHARYTQHQLPAAKVATTLTAPTTQSFKLYFEICEKVKPILAETNGFAPWWYFLKVAAILAVVVAMDVYALLWLRPLWATALQSLFMGFIGLNLQHDGNHGAVSRDPRVNRAMGLMQDYIGGSSAAWRVNHNTVHHVHCNDTARDHDLDIPLLRLKTAIPYKAHYALQQVYLMIISACFGPLTVIQNSVFSWTADSEARLLAFSDDIRTSKFLSVVPVLRQLVFLWHGASWGFFFATGFLNYSIGGLYLAFFFLMSHNFDGVRKEGIDSTSDDFVRNQVETSSNVGGAILSFFNGGLNFQIEHHLFPRVHHYYYHQMAPIVAEVCRKHGIRYTHFRTIQENFNSTFEHLTKLGRDPKKG